MNALKVEEKKIDKVGIPSVFGGVAKPTMAAQL